MMSIYQILEDLQTYGRTRDPIYKPRRLELAKAAAEKFPECAGKDKGFDVFCWLYDKAFALMWQQMTDYRDTQYEIRETLIEPARKYFTPEPLRQKGKIKRVAYLCAQTTVSGPYANGRSLYSFAKGHSGDFEMYWYNYGAGEPQVVENLRAMGYTFRNFGGSPSEKVANIRAACEFDEIDVLIADMYWSVPLALFEMRSAPYQLYLSMGFQKFPADKVLLMDTMTRFDEDAAIIPYTLAEEFLYQEDMANPRYGEVVLGTHCRREKCSPEFMAVVEEILDQRPNAHYVTYGRGTLNSAHPRIHIKEADSPHRILPSIDVYLDTFPLCGCMSVLEAGAHGVPAITWSHESTKSYDRFKGVIVNSREEYIAEAVKMIDSQPYRDFMGAAGKARAMKVTDVKAGAQAIEGILWQLQLTPN